MHMVNYRAAARFARGQEAICCDRQRESAAAEEVVLSLCEVKSKNIIDFLL